ncbi:unnamed protein product [Somion occarium]|uniref:Cation efflux protein transmembrane domain-containing protein n=2 Tax=Somion occarium TaxID=3059160 RepID=A0ABP1DPI9_9APHY
MAADGNSTIQTSHIHRRKSSREEDDNILIFPTDTSSLPTLMKPPGIAVQLEPNGLASTQLPPSQSHPPSAGPYRTSFAIPRPPALNGVSNTHLHPMNGHHRHQAPSMRQSLSLPSHSSSHSRTRSVSGPFSPSTPSPLSSSFPSSTSSPFPSKPTSPTLYRFPGPSSSESDLNGTPPNGRAVSIKATNGITPSSSTGSSAAGHIRRHSRLHSRNLSIYFPRPGSLPSTSIAEDGYQELDFTPSSSLRSVSSNSDDSSVLMPSMSSPTPGQRSFREGFTFGARPPADSNGELNGHAMPEMTPSNRASRRGHHHKHSLSHNFFSFLEPGDELHTNPTPTPVSPWNPGSSFPSSPSGPAAETSAHAHSHSQMHAHSHSHSHSQSPEPHAPESHSDVHPPRSKSPIGSICADPAISPVAVTMATLQFALGAALWISGQQTGSLACTGLGYWVVFDSFGIALGSVVPSWLAKPSMKNPSRRPFGNARLETLLIYAQSIYLVFAAVYVCKETLEHFLLASGEGHHHHHGDEVTDIFGIDFPPFLLLMTMGSLLVSAVGFDNQAKLVSIANNFIPPVQVLLPARYRYRSPSYPSYLANLLSNPYTLSPLFFCGSIFGAYLFIPPFQHRDFDLFLAAVETIVTFYLAYPAAVALGSVLLQTAPSRGLPGARMEAFLRAMREIERHPKVLHVPPPHIWQLTPPLQRPSGYGARHPKALGPAQRIVVTMELHTSSSITDQELLELTQWAQGRCMNALRFGMGEGDGGECEAEVGVGIIREDPTKIKE